MSNKEDLNIFDSTVPQTGEFYRFDKIGDALQGTYIDTREGINGFGDEQIIYVIKDSNDGKIWNVGFRKDKAVVHERMKTVRHGQIVGFRFDEEQPSKVKKGTMAKIIRIYADPKFVDHEWLNSQKELEIMYGRVGEKSAPAETSDTPVENKEENMEVFPTGASTPNLPQDNIDKAKNDALDAIRSLAKTKGLVGAKDSVYVADKKIEEYAELPLEEANFTKIIIALTGYVSK